MFQWATRQFTRQKLKITGLCVLNAACGFLLATYYLDGKIKQKEQEYTKAEMDALIVMLDAEDDISRIANSGPIVVDGEVMNYDLQTVRSVMYMMKAILIANRSTIEKAKQKQRDILEVKKKEVFDRFRRRETFDLLIGKARDEQLSSWMLLEELKDE